MTKLVSGIRPTGNIHVGNYYGAMKGLIELQNKYDAHYFIADLHSLTTHRQGERLRENVINAARDYLSAGLDPTKCTLYAQSSIAKHICELHTYFSMVMPMGELMRCPTFKEKAKRHPSNVNYGLVGYPVLMTADIMIHKGEVVPVGEDQLVHLEIARTIVRKFNHLYGEVFVEPQSIIDNAVRIPSLSGKGKMSKSDSDDSYISMTDHPQIIQSKVKRAYTDPNRIYRSDPGNPTKDGCNVFHLHSYFTEKQIVEDIQQQCKNAEIGCMECKNMLSQSIINILAPIQEQKVQYSDVDVIDILKMGQKKAEKSAELVIAEVRKAMGFIMY
ncbi:MULTISPECIES: tryptophan--tRNA ligase [Bacillaceae]|uniref:tryptophan--tRNA ligase n=1 Tax=Bacillaceae TaxID=186817 RepID=UPI0020330DA9|nr:MULTISPECIES: tryptophan--tRNA ligase [Bacillaceae]MDX8362863.1 tryptophan--tRNA ligase [Cytobacillus sp. IB215316]